MTQYRGVAARAPHRPRVLLFDERQRLIAADSDTAQGDLIDDQIIGREILRTAAGVLGADGTPVSERVCAGAGGVQWAIRAVRLPGGVGGAPSQRQAGAAVAVTVDEFDASQQDRYGMAQRWRAVFDSDRIGVAVRDAENRLVECNKTYARIFDAPSPEALVGTPPAAILAPEDAATAVQRKDLHWTGEPTEFHVDREYTLRGGRRISIHASVAIVRDAAGRPRYQLSLVEDTTDRRRLEAELTRARRMEAIGRLAGGVARDVNNTLAVIVGYTELISKALGPGHELQVELDEISRAAEHSRLLARDLLTFGGRQVLERQMLAAGAVVAALKPLLGRTLSEAIELTVVDRSGRALVVGDRAQLETAIINLAANARDAMPDGGKLLLSVDVAPPRPGEPADRVVISVADTGVGMTDAVRENIFEPFFTTKGLGQGTGLGLATVAGIIEQMGGEISVQSVLGEGSTFTLTLPGCPAPPAPVAGAEGAGDSPDVVMPPGRTILVVEDEAQLSRLVERLLTDAGYRVITAASGEEALELLRDRDARIDLLLTDMILPDLHGGELARMALQLRSDLRVVYTSGYPGASVVRDGMPPGHGFLAKPYAGSDLTECLNAAFDPPVSG